MTNQQDGVNLSIESEKKSKPQAAYTAQLESDLHQALNKVSDGNLDSLLTLRQTMIRSVGHRLFVLLVLSMVCMAVWSSYVYFCVIVSEECAKNTDTVGALLPVVFVGVLGGIISLQKRLNKMPVADLLLLRNSFPFLLLAPLVGGFLATMLYLLFIGELLKGGLFPTFVPDADADPSSQGMASVLKVHGETVQDYGKLLFWCFVAGFSERFVTNLIGHFEGVGSQGQDSSSTAEPEAKN